MVFLLLTLNIFYTFFSVSIVDFEQVNVSWVTTGNGLHLQETTNQVASNSDGKAITFLDATDRKLHPYQILTLNVKLI